MKSVKQKIPDLSEFCQNCGEKLEKTKESNKSGFMGWWNNQGNGVKAISVLGACCVGLIVILTVIGMIFPDAAMTNTTNTTPPTTTQKVQPATVNDTSMFENQFVKFKKPTDLTIKDVSTDNKLDVLFYQGDKLMGEVNSATTTTKYY